MDLLLVSKKIKDFVEEHQDCDIVVCTGYISTYGISELASVMNTEHKATIIIGDMRNVPSTSDKNKYAALHFITNENVEVYSWYKKKPVHRMAHGKAILARKKGKTVAALVGSANLTRNGLDENLEIMVLCDKKEHHILDAYVETATEYDPVTDRLIKQIEQTDKPKRSTQNKSAKNNEKNESDLTIKLPIGSVKKIVGQLNKKIGNLVNKK